MLLVDALEIQTVVSRGEKACKQTRMRIPAKRVEDDSPRSRGSPNPFVASRPASGHSVCRLSPARCR